MTERRYQKVLDRDLSLLLPHRLDDYVSDDSKVRAIDAWVNLLDLNQLGFRHTEKSSGAGQPAYDPAVLLKLYVFGYQNGVRSSRKLEYQTRCNTEVMWLCQGAQPSYKTIADFRKNNLSALKAAQRDFVMLCRDLDLLAGKQVAVDGSFLKADANKSSIYTSKRLQQQLKKLEKKIASYLQQLDETDQREEADEEVAEMQTSALLAKLERMQKREEELKLLQEKLEQSGEKQISTVDEDARLMTKKGVTTGGYNVQLAVDEKQKLIVAQEVTQDGNDTQQLAPMLRAAKDATGSEELCGLADKGYFSGEQLKQCEEQSLTVYVPIPKQPNRRGRDGRFGSDDFRYDKDADLYVCPAEQQLVRAGSATNSGRRYHTYRSDVATCSRCELSTQCLSESACYRRLQRWEHEDVVDRHRQRMADSEGKMRTRGALVEHPFGTLKRWAGMDHFLMRGLAKCRGEFSLMTLSYNFKRVLNIVGIEAMMSYCALNQQTS